MWSCSQTKKNQFSMSTNAKGLKTKPFADTGKLFMLTLETKRYMLQGFTRRVDTNLSNKSRCLRGEKAEGERGMRRLSSNLEMKINERMKLM